MNDSGIKKFRTLEILGIPFIFLGGTFLHFLYELTNKSVMGILFGSVNESVWEHIKIFALPYIVWAIIELAFSIPYFKQFVVAKVFGLYLQCLLITGFFYFYTFIIGSSILWLDILSVFVWIFVSQFASYKLTTADFDIRHFFPLAIGSLFLFFMMFFSFTAVPPHIPLFQDPITKLYGIIPKNLDVGAFFMQNI